MGRPLLPLRQFVLKMHSRCDLACDHCYVYEHADQSWRGRPRVMSDLVLRATAERVAEHAKTHGRAPRGRRGGRGGRARPGRPPPARGRRRR
ncbi:hypothetical protein, partial [Streptomyces bottropensis]|uniref:hypothetical protein n=1 Tax=Streptomyces bottropensis TaxID=42235 RepID=UPI00369D1FEE